MKLWDAICDKCGHEYTDVWECDLGGGCNECQDGKIKKHFRSAPVIDYRDPFQVPTLGGGSFSSNLEAERYAVRTGQELLTDSQRESRISQAQLQIKKQREAERREAVQRSFYRLKHGYRDYPKLDKEV